MSYRGTVDLDGLSDSSNYFVRHWRGHLSLPVSYWVNGFLVSAFVTALTLWFTYEPESGGLSLRTVAAVSLLNLLFVGLVSIWSAVGIWRSAGFHEARGGSVGWANVARLLVVVGALGAFGQSRNTAMSATEYMRLALGDDPFGPPAQMTFDQARKAIVVDGALSLGTAERFNSLVSQHHDSRRVILRSAGGRTLEAQQMAETIARMGLDTEVKQSCLSACTLVLLAGRERSATENARVGFHQPTFPGLTLEEQQEATSGLRRLYEKAGVTSDFLEEALKAPPESMWYPTHADLLNGNVLNTTNVVYSKKAVEARRAQLVRGLQSSAQQLNEAGRVRVDSMTVRTGATATGNVLTVRFLVEELRENMDVAAGKRAVFATVHKDACADRPTRQAVDAGAVVVFSYNDVNGRNLFDLRVDECNSIDAG